MTTAECDVERLAEFIHRGEVTFLVGAGVSMNRRSCVPGWLQLMTALLEEIAGPERRTDVACFQERMRYFFNEFVLQQLSQHVGRSRALEAVKCCIAGAQPSGIHRFLAWCVGQLKNRLLTTNFDDLVGHAMHTAGHDAKAARHCTPLHGVISRPGTLRMQASQLFQPLSPSLEGKALRNLHNRHLVVIGYNGQDDFDGMPVAFRAPDESGPLSISWVVHQGYVPQLNDPDYLNDPRLQWVPSHREAGKGRPEKVDTDEFLRMLYRSLVVRGAPSDAVLDDWGRIEERGDTDRWREDLRVWGKDLRQEKPKEVALLWFDLVNHMRLYRARRPRARKTCNLAEEAYKYAKGVPGLTLLEELRLDLDMAHARRLIGAADESAFTRIITPIEEQYQRLRRRKDLKASKRRREYADLLRRALHQYAIVLQNAGKHDDASGTLDRAIALARDCPPGVVAYSIFQKFMNAWLASRRQPDSLARLAPRNWRTTLPRTLRNAAKTFHRQSLFEDYATTMHNLGFVWQHLGGEQDDGRHWPEAEALYRKAIDAYEEGKVYRQRLRDPRMIAQGEVRLGQCRLRTANVLINRYPDGKEDAQSLDFLIQALAHASEAMKRYEEVPQEGLRYDDVRGLLAEIRGVIDRHEVTVPKSAWHELQRLSADIERLSPEKDRG